LLGSQTTDEEVILEPQPGPQTEFTETLADIAIIGGSGGGGKTHACNLEVLGNIENPEFTFLYIRKHMADITQTGGLLDATQKIFPLLGGTYNQNNHEWTFPSGCVGGFGHMEDMYRYKSAEICLFIFEEVNELEEDEFWYMFSRNRSTCGVKPYIRATANPAPGWLADLLVAGGYVDEETGYAVDAMSGVIRWIVRDDDGDIQWFDTEAEANAAFPHLPALSFTFIRARVEDNPALLEKDPMYLAKLNALPAVERARMRDGNWKVKPSAGKVFKEEWFRIRHDTLQPDQIDCLIRYWDLAATEEDPKGKKDPDWTAGVLMAITKEKRIRILDLIDRRDSPLEIENLITVTAKQDDEQYRDFGFVRVGIECDPGQAGKSQIAYYKRQLMGHLVEGYSTDRKSKIQRAGPMSSQAGCGNVELQAGEWNKRFVKQHHEFPDGKKKDIVDATSGAFIALTKEGAHISDAWEMIDDAF
jgi:predicted phage terminase large subunit-like protein